MEPLIPPAKIGPWQRAHIGYRCPRITPRGLQVSCWNIWKKEDCRVSQTLAGGSFKWPTQKSETAPKRTGEDVDKVLTGGQESCIGRPPRSHLPLQATQSHENRIFLPRLDLEHGFEPPIHENRIPLPRLNQEHGFEPPRTRPPRVYEEHVAEPPVRENGVLLRRENGILPPQVDQEYEVKLAAPVLPFSWSNTASPNEMISPPEGSEKRRRSTEALVYSPHPVGSERKAIESRKRSKEMFWKHELHKLPHRFP
jgi:hypothetical protein